jgi:hypothetical protein
MRARRYPVQPTTLAPASGSSVRYFSTFFNFCDQSNVASLRKVRPHKSKETYEKYERLDEPATEFTVNIPKTDRK